MNVDTSFWDTTWFSLGVVPVLIFVSRLWDVTMEAIRVIFITRGLKMMASVMGFFEVFVYIAVLSQIFGNYTSTIHYIAYATGFAAGNYLGIWIESRIAIGTYVLRVFIRQNVEELTKALNNVNFGVTSIVADSSIGPVKQLIMLVPRKKVEIATNLIKQHDKDANYSIEDVRFVQKGIFPKKKKH